MFWTFVKNTWALAGVHYNYQPTLHFLELFLNLEFKAKP